MFKMSLRLVVLTLVTVSARNLHRDNVRDVSSPQTKLDFETPYHSDGKRMEHSSEEFHSAVSRKVGDFSDQRRPDSEFDHHGATRASNGQGNERHHNFDNVNKQSINRHRERGLEGRELNSEIERESHGYGLENFGLTNINHRSIENNNKGRQQNANQDFFGSGTHEFGSRTNQNEGRGRNEGSSVLETELKGFEEDRSSRPESSNNDDQFNTNRQQHDPFQTGQGSQGPSRTRPESARDDKFYTNREEQNLKDLHSQIQNNEKRRDEVFATHKDIFENNRYRGQTVPNDKKSSLNQRLSEETRQSERDIVPQNHNVARHIDTSQINQQDIYDDRRESPNNNRHRENENRRDTNQHNEGYGNDENVLHNRQQNVQRRGQPTQDNTRDVDTNVGHADRTIKANERNRNRQNNGNIHKNTRTDPRHGQSNKNHTRNQGVDGRNHQNAGKVLDNEVLKHNNNSSNAGRESGDDKWVWSVENEKKPDSTSTTPETVTLDDRAAFSGDKCPTGKVKIGDKCVEVD